MSGSLSHKLAMLVTGALILAVLGFALAHQTRPVVPPPAKQALTGASAAWVCVTPRSYCTSVPKPRGAPCSCYDAMQGLTMGRVDRTHLPGSGVIVWPQRERAAGDEPEALDRGQ